MADNENDVPNTEELKTDDAKSEASPEESGDTKYDLDDFEPDTEAEVAKTDEEKCAEKNTDDSPGKEDVEVKTDDEKLGTNTKEEDAESVPVNTESEHTTEMSEPAETKTEERAEDAQSADQPEESKAEQEEDGGAVQNEADAEPTDQDSEAQQEQVTSENETVNKSQESTVDTVQDEKQESVTAEGEKDDNEKVPIESGDPIDKEELNSKIQENEDLSLKLESTLSNQEAERDAYKKLTEENARLQKRHDDMKEKFEDMEGGHVLLVAEVETLRKVNGEQRETIVKLEAEIKVLKETQGGDENVKDMQEKLIRMASEQEEKDRRIHSLEGELDATKEKLKDAETRAVRGGNNTVQNSKTCVIM